MDIKKLLIGGIAGGILYFLLGYLVYGVLIMDFMRANPGPIRGLDRSVIDFKYLTIGNLVQGFLLAYILIKSNVDSLAKGLITGGIVGLLMSVSFDAIMYATTNVISRKAMLADVIAFAVISAIVGAVVGMILGMGKKSTA
jgi:hypothetical protein